MNNDLTRRNPAPCAEPPSGTSPGYREVTIERNTPMNNDLIDLAERAIEEWLEAHDGEEIDCRALARIAVMQGEVGGLPDEVERDLTELYCRLNEGVFYRDYDEDGRLMGVLRKHLAALTNKGANP